jgi:hypothetical protein
MDDYIKEEVEEALDLADELFTKKYYREYEKEARGEMYPYMEWTLPRTPEAIAVLTAAILSYVSSERDRRS